ncbi:MAG: DUF3306 domain-containing protein [Litoreibacter sp.]|nr:DUF3306 domain-containing protein [Litoreibacter sp.]
MSGDFWSRRREAVAQEALAEEAALIAVEKKERDAELAEKSDEELLSEAGLATPETLESPEQVREFLTSALPQRLKTRALRRLWRLNPVLANIDGLVDYGEDFTDSATVIENLQTTYQVGKGMLAHVEEMARQAEAAEAQEAEEEEPVEVEEAPAEIEEPPVLVAQVEAPDEPFEAPEEEEVFAPAPRRRMTFTFDEQRTG